MEVLRPAGFNERRCIARDVLGAYGCIITVARYSTANTSAVTDIKKTIHTALRKCVRRHAALSVVVQDATTEKPVLAKVRDVDLAKHLTILSPTTDDRIALSALLNTAHAEPLHKYGSQPQWRVWALPVTDTSSCYVAFATSHAIMDGRSGTMFHHSLLEALNGTAQDQDKLNSDTMLAPALDKAATFPISWSFLLRPLLEEMLPASIATAFGLQTETTAWCGADARPSLPATNKLLPTALKVLLIPPEMLSRLLTVCRKHKSKLTALLNFTISQSLAAALHKRDQDHLHFTTSTPYDLRRQIPGSHSRMANYVSAVDQTLTVQHVSLPDWEQIAHATTMLRERSSTLNDQPIALLSYLSKFHEWVKKRAAQPAKVSFSVSNLGNFSTGHDQSWTVSQMAFSQSADATGAALNINVASSYGGPLSIVVTWWPGMLGVDDENDFAQDVCDDLAARLALTATF